MIQPHDLPEHLLAAYRETDYSFTTGDQIIVIRLDEDNPALLSYLQQEGISNWAYLTAWNPLSFQQTDEYNQSQQQLLLSYLEGYKIYKGEGKGRDGSWPTEEGLFVAGISREKAEALGLDFGQNAILVSKENLQPELVVLYPLPPYSSRVSTS